MFYKTLVYKLVSGKYPGCALAEFNLILISAYSSFTGSQGYLLLGL